jgi:hypothetical protein
MKMNKIWEIWKYSLGSFSDDKTAPYDNYVAIIRTSIFVSYMVTNAFIISGVIRHWNKVNSNVVTGTNPQVSHVSGTALAEKVGRMSRPLDLVERIVGYRSEQ